MSSAVYLRSSSCSTPDKVIALPFPSTLTTMALDHRSLRRFETSSCKPIPRDQPSYSMKHRFRRCYGDRFRSTQYAVAFPRMSRSIVTRANSARKRLISICSAVTALLPTTAFNVPARCACTQLERVCSTPPRLRAAAARLWPDSTSRTASCLNSSVYRPRFPFLIVVSLSLLKQLAKGYVLRGQGHRNVPVPGNRRHCSVHLTS